MEDLKEIAKTILLTEIKDYFKRCKIYVFFIDNDILRICAHHDGEQFQQVYINPIEELFNKNDYLKKVSTDFISKYSKWILAQYRGW